MKDLVPVANKIVDKVESALQAMSAKMGIASEQLWLVLIKQAYVSALINGIIVVAILTGILIWYKYTLFWSRKMKNDGWDKEGWTGILIISVIGGVMGFIGITVNTINAIQNYINPEYFALKEILKVIN